MSESANSEAVGAFMKANGACYQAVQAKGQVMKLKNC